LIRFIETTDSFVENYQQMLFDEAREFKNSTGKNQIKCWMKKKQKRNETKKIKYMLHQKLN